MFLIVGLGNPGKEYKYTRHNLGFIIVEQLAKDLQVSFKKRKLYWIAITNYKDIEVVLLKPMTYMNLSGRAVEFIVNKHRIDFSQILVICDDINLPFGQIRIRGKGSDGGHNGLASIIEYLNTLQFPRLRIGIGSRFSKDQVTEFVLSPFATKEINKITDIIDVARHVVWSFIEKGLMVTMNEYN